MTERVIGSRRSGALAARVVLATAKDSKADGEHDRLPVRVEIRTSGRTAEAIATGFNLKENRRRRNRDNMLLSAIR